jgi:hypothetical protein
VATIKVGVREFRERIASFLESDSPVAVTRRGETLGVYVPTRRKRPKKAELSELKAAADRLAKGYHREFSTWVGFAIAIGLFALVYLLIGVLRQESAIEECIMQSRHNCSQLLQIGR